MERRIAELLNSSKDGNIFSLEHEAVNELIQEYFAFDKPADDVPVDGECCDDGEIVRCIGDFRKLKPSPTVSPTASDNTEDEIGEATDGPIVTVDEPGDSQVLLCNGVAEGQALVAEFGRFSCNCRMIRVPAPAPGDDRRGCCTQFTPQEMQEYNDLHNEMDRGKKSHFVKQDLHFEFFKPFNLMCRVGRTTEALF